MTRLEERGPADRSAAPEPLARPGSRLHGRTVRILVGFLLIAFAGGVLVADRILESTVLGSCLLVLLSAGAFLEFARMSRLGSLPAGGIFLGLGVLGTIYFPVAAWAVEAGRSDPRADLIGCGLGAAAAALFLTAVTRSEFSRAFEGVTLTLSGVVLCGLLLSYVVRVYHVAVEGRPLGEGLLRAGSFLLGVKGTDIIAYFVGSAVGRRPFLEVSPRKTLEGALAGLVHGMVWFSVVSFLWPGTFLAWPLSLLAGASIAVATQLGDLAESLLKRRYCVKDSSRLLPEFGGVLDLMDSFLFSGLVFWLLAGA